MSEHLDQLNTALTGRYAIQRPLGAGGMGTVFLAEDLRHPRRVAIKVLNAELAAVLGSERFLREIEIAAGLNHPHILPVHESGSADGLLYYVMPYAEGESLRQRLEREKQLPLADALRIAREVADALDHAHRRGVVHRDIKPENILLWERHAVVADFGIARAIAAAGGERLTATGLVMGTPAYMSPELVVGRGDVDGRSDVYGLGCVLYEMLAGQPPFTAATAESLAYQHLSVTPRPVRELRPAVPEQVERAIGRTLAKAAADRFGTAAELAAALDSREPVAATVRASGAAAPVRRRAWRLAAIAGTALTIAAIGLLGVKPRRQAPALVVPGHVRSEIAVLPFENLSNEGPHAFFARGLHDELLTQLSKVAALKVISRTSVMGYQSTSKPLKTIASELGVGSVVEGSVQVVGERLRVTVQLIDATSDEHLWAEHYDRTLDDAFAIQSEVAQAIVVAVGAALTGTEQRRLATPPTANAEAYRLYLQGNEYMNRPGRRPENLESAGQLFERALALDPNFAIAQASLSLAHSELYWTAHGPTAARLARAREEAEAALRLGPDLPEAHFAMAMVEFVSLAYRRAVDEFAIALKGLPNDAVLWRMSGFAYRRLGDWKEVTTAFERAAQLNPRDADLFYFLGGHTYRYLRRYPEAVRAYERALSLAPDVQEWAIDIGLTYFQWQGQLDTLRAVLGRFPRDAKFGQRSVAGVRADLLLFERAADSLLQMPEVARANLAGNEYFPLSSIAPGIDGGRKVFHSTTRCLYVAWAHQLRGDQAAARAAFDSARVSLDSWLGEHPDDWNAHYARGMALAGLGRRGEALREARWLEQSVVYREDALGGPYLAEGRAQILAQVGDAERALDEIERLLAKPSDVSVQTLRLDPRWDPIRDHPRFKALLAKYTS